jgi:hypothetical protein
MSRGKHSRWIWPLGLAVAGLGAATTMLFRGCWHTQMGWPLRYDEHYSYQVCNECGIKRLYDPTVFRAYGPFGYDVHDLIARDRARRIKRLHKLSA